MKAIIMAGGQGTRFWPWSIKEKPKQFLTLSSDKTMIQETYDRFRKWLPIEKIFVVTTDEYYSLVIEQLPEINSDQIILEPERRDTGPCVALSALHFLEKQEDEVIVTVPSDQYISDGELFRNSMITAEKAAQKDRSIVTLGIVPTRPETGYGYIEAKEGVGQESIVPVKKFIEKPSLKQAVELLKNKNVYWNSGIFLWKPSTIAYYMELLQKDIWRTLLNNRSNLKQAYSKLPKISVDYAILEKAEKVYMIPAKFEWDDLGSWCSVERIQKENDKQNLELGNVYTLESNNCIVISDKQKALVIGVDDLIIVSTEEGLLVSHKSKEQIIKKALNSTWVNHSKEKGR
ncbi:mannose-1-phosphate guanylyltransferase [Priestia aryabhattai]|uniref:mannose-1-phosphate guanylyltransferase n=1 Tax=Priestia TaxID=2800373 RepID=UPI001C8EC79D|nr:mannose-1-phosphate guanylyltransferase [Priestia aryabhattai]MBY0074703.1 mannose-1-phosphate guanylyltransferase [Priestia aryabhattai]